MSGRRRRQRCIEYVPTELCFKPCGRQGRELETVTLRPDEIEALRLADLVGLYQEECARRMGISRTTLSRTLAEARRKLADALIHGKKLVLESDTRSAEAPEARRQPMPATPAVDQSPPEQSGAEHEENRFDGE
ncbi:DUF134 domain-containing protein [Imhoffiella purpurea]|uniref:UPF0251 protein D779_2849 n=1 Tax=Imhoffiella purpurea TaxID=1249627 RepID=W9V3T5_9GAMM|nr:DUF134 domain-containing protein [Imhoffiella purpurea]EXJ14178.1 hypothetical protein D779_2849 [Imhoffiella purpurea]